MSSRGGTALDAPKVPELLQGKPIKLLVLCRKANATCFVQGRLARTELLLEATEIKVKAERVAGQMLLAMQ